MDYLLPAEPGNSFCPSSESIFFQIKKNGGLCKLASPCTLAELLRIRSDTLYKVPIAASRVYTLKFTHRVHNSVHTSESTTLEFARTCRSTLPWPVTSLDSPYSIFLPCSFVYRSFTSSLTTFPLLKLPRFLPSASVSPNSEYSAHADSISSLLTFHVAQTFRTKGASESANACTY
jgi:hypothetical protein